MKQCTMCTMLLIITSLCPLCIHITNCFQISPLKEPVWPKKTTTEKDYTIERRELLYKTISNALLTAVSSPANSATIEELDAEITDKVSFEVRISRSDGTFYVRDDIEKTPENTVYKYSLTFGLFGTIAPNHVSKFLSYVTYNPNSPLDESPLPSYSSSTFTSLDQATGLINAYIPGLQLTDFNGASALRYSGRLIPATLWIENPPKPKIPHSSPLLLTHKVLDLTPSFSITTRSNPDLDYTHVVFGTILPDPSSFEFLQVIKSIPTYTLNTPTTSVAEADFASKVFSAQKEFFRGAAKSLGDSRIDNVYEGKFLRRIEVTKVGII